MMDVDANIDGLIPQKKQDAIFFKCWYSDLELHILSNSRP